MRSKNTDSRKKQDKGASRGLIVIGVGALVLLAVVVMAMLPTIKRLTPLPPLASPTAGTPATPTLTVTVDPNSPTPVPPTPTLSYPQWSSAPAMSIDADKQYFATFKMAKGGEFTVQLYPDKAPVTVNSFVFLARKGFFDGVTFHRVLDGFMAQGGDPSGTGMGGPGYQFAYEANDLKFDKPGVLAMANRGAATPTNGSQFFITFVPVPELDGGYTIFGQVTSGMEVVNAITRRDPQQNPDFPGDSIESIVIEEK